MGNEFFCYGKICSEENYLNSKIKYNSNFNYYKDSNNNCIATLKDNIPFNSSNIDIIWSPIYGQHLDLNVIKELYKKSNIILQDKLNYNIYYIYLNICNGRNQTNILECVNYPISYSKERLEKLQSENNTCSSSSESSTNDSSINSNDNIYWYNKN